ncbi:hypothetical protein IEQ34_016352 [Dendrobium chrysotoxum]|uniref:Uncharacterized protein n=1 Tax=Dendrobium chrysotoxum TaxID=161865 RepID=A0AAV7GGA0_DENCH|nr:hypothetical protein IEQ34_016352 [Dendrobium chrysotoxum]
MKSITFKSIIQEHVQEAHDHIYAVERKTGIEIEGLTPSQAFNDPHLDSSDDDDIKIFFSDDEIIEIVWYFYTTSFITLSFLILLFSFDYHYDLFEEEDTIGKEPTIEPELLLLPPEAGREPELLSLPPKQVENLNSFCFLLKWAENLDLLANDPPTENTEKTRDDEWRR